MAGIEWPPAENARTAEIEDLARPLYAIQSAADVPQDDEWLAYREEQELRTLRFAPRRRDWRLGRWTAKRLLGAQLTRVGWRIPLDQIEIRAAADGAPEAWIDQLRAPYALSLSHREGRAVAAIADPATSLGCDLEHIEPHGDDLVEDFFTAAERRLVERASPAERDRSTAVLWSAKESALKALREGLRLDTRAVEVELFPEGAEWSRLLVRYPEGRRDLYGHWRTEGDLVLTVVSSARTEPPERLEPRALAARAGFSG
jgi:4'-phosphopantetheinyl transferase